MNRRLLDSIKHRPLVIAEGSFLKYAITRSIVSLNGDESKIAKSPYLQPLCDSENDSFKFHPPMLLEKQNYKYLKPFSIAQKLQTRKAVLLPGSIDEPNADNARSRLPRGYFLVPKGLFCAVPLGCFNFSVDNQFPDENSLKNWLEIMERAMESASLHYEQVSLALIGMAKIQIATDGQFAQKIGWPLLVRWFSYVYEKLAQEKRTRKFLTVYDNMCRSAYRFIMNGVPRQVKPEDYAEIKRLTCDLLPRYCDYGLERLCATHGMVLTDDEADQRRVYILEKMVSVLWQVEFAFQPTSSLLDDEVSAQMSKNILEVAPHWIRNMGYGSKSLSDYDAGLSQAQRSTGLKILPGPGFDNLPGPGLL
uniref:Uncharacterized protein n=1 Tax=Romanomermis culicivorax TaxID=13658 RepID=A0A915L8X3_ROMCU